MNTYFWGFLVFCCCITSLEAVNEVIVINNMKDFWVMYERAWKTDFQFDVDMRCDLDFDPEVDGNKGQSFAYPLGVNPKTLSYNPFIGSWKGNGFSVHNIQQVLPNQMLTDSTFIRGITGPSRVENLHFAKTCSFDGAWASSLSDYVVGDVEIVNVNSAAKLKGYACAAGIAIASLSTQSGTASVFDSCSFSGTITTYEEAAIFAGGILAMARHTASPHTTKIKNCHNTGSITLVVKNSDKFSLSYNPAAGGIIASLDNSAGVSSVVLEDCSNDGFVNVTVLAGSNIPRKIVSVGGIAGTLIAPTNSNTDVMVTRCRNKGKVEVAVHSANYDVQAAGIVANAKPSSSAATLITHCVNSGSVTAKTISTPFQSVTAAGIASSSSSSANEKKSGIRSCANSGDLMSISVACGIACNIGHHIDNSVNSGHVSAASTSYGVSNNVLAVDSVVSIGAVSLTGASGTAYLTIPTPLPPSTINPLKVFFSNKQDASGVTMYGSEMEQAKESGRWVAKSDNNIDCVDVLNKEVEEQQYAAWWSKEMNLGTKVTVNVVPNSDQTVCSVAGLEHRSMIVGEIGETLRKTITREAPDLLDTAQHALFDGKTTDTNVDLDKVVTENMVIKVKCVHTLEFGAPINKKLHVVDNSVLSGTQVDQLRKWIDDKYHFVIVDSKSDATLNVLAPVKKSAVFIVHDAVLMKVVVKSTVDEATAGEVLLTAICAKVEAKVCRGVTAMTTSKNSDKSISVNIRVFKEYEGIIANLLNSEEIDIVQHYSSISDIPIKPDHSLSVAPHAQACSFILAIAATAVVASVGPFNDFKDGN